MNFQKYIERIGGESLLGIQEKLIQAASEHTKIALYSPTGSGKTLAYLFGVLQAFDLKKASKALIICPSRELAIQIHEVIKAIQIEHTSTLCYGGHPFKTECNNLKSSPSIIISTPGRAADHIRRNSFDVTKIDLLVIDEEDKIREIGFQNELDFIFTSIHQNSSIIRVSASGNITNSSEFKDYCIIDERHKASTPNFSYFKINFESDEEKADALVTLLKQIEAKKTIVFFNHREAVERMSHFLNKSGIENCVYHGGLEQNMRELNLIKFSNDSAKLLIVTDLAARGLDISEVENIIHYQIAKDEASFLHRNGRTARIGKNGNVFCMMSEHQTALPEFYSSIEWSALKSKVGRVDDWESNWTTLYVSLGKKNKVNKVDILGFLTKEMKISAQQIGKINSLDYCTFVAVKKSFSSLICKQSAKLKIKKQKVLIKVAK